MFTDIQGLREQLDTVNSFIDEFLACDSAYHAIQNIIHAASHTRGKLIRPSMLLLSARFGPNGSSEELCKLGALVEIIHMASLIHDDIIDNALLRRGEVTLQAEFGKDIAVYAGDFLLCRVMLHILRSDLGEAGITLAETIEEMCKGELGQMACRYNIDTTERMYLDNVYGKTVAMFSTAFRLGAITGGCGAAEVSLLTGIGKQMGWMFQMRDDILDFISDEQREGKPLLKDFDEGIYTMPVLFALKTGVHTNRLREIALYNAELGRFGGLRDSIKEEMRYIVLSSGGIEYTLDKMEEHKKKALRLLNGMPRNECTHAITEMLLRINDVHIEDIRFMAPLKIR